MALTLIRQLDDDLPAFVRACIELDELGYRPKDEFEPGDEYLILHDDTDLAAVVGSRPIVRADVVRIGSWAQCIGLADKHWIVAVPSLDALLSAIADIVGSDNDITLGQAWYAGHSPSDVKWRATYSTPRKPTDTPLSIHRGGGFTVAIEDYADYWGAGDSWREAAAESLSRLLRDRCEQCHEVSKGRRGHREMGNGEPCPVIASELDG